MTGLRVACVGAGYFSQFHYDSWRRLAADGRISLVGACDHDIIKATATGHRAFDDLSDMLDATRPDILDIILPPSAQAEAIQLALRAGIKILICQKPFCRDLTEAHQVTDAAQAAGARLVVHENVRFQPWYRALKAALLKDAIGQVHQLTFRLRPGDGQGPRAYLDRQPYFRDMQRFLVHETAVHWLDTFRYLLGDPKAVYADLRRMNPAISGEDAGCILLDFESGARALFDGNRHLDHATDNPRRTLGEALVEGTRGTITLDGDGVLLLRAFGKTQAERLLAKDTSPNFGGDCVHALQSHVLHALETGAQIENLAADYLRVLQIEDAVYRSAAEGRKIAL